MVKEQKLDVRLAKFEVWAKAVAVSLLFVTWLVANNAKIVQPLIDALT